MSKIDKLKEHLAGLYSKRTPTSRGLYKRAEKVMTEGGSHTLRLFKPYPIFLDGARGSRIRDIDGNEYIDYWQGHYANILGHDPSVINRGLGRERGRLGHNGFESPYQIELAELILGSLGGGDYKVRFTTSGSLATMYSVMLAKGFTGRDLVLKIGGGWHGASPYLLKGVRYQKGPGYNGPDSAGVSDSILNKTMVGEFSDCEDLEKIMKRCGDRIACFIMEPFIGTGGFLPASLEYVKLARSLATRHGIVLVFDEIISGFRFCPSGVQTLYGTRPDLTVFGKIIGGGHAVSAVVGRSEIMDGALMGPNKVKFEGGTFSAHPEYMRAGVKVVRHLIENGDRIYPRIGRGGEKLRRGITGAFEAEGFPLVMSGGGNDVVRSSSLFLAHLTKKEIPELLPKYLQNPEYSDIDLREATLRLALLVNGVHTVHGGGSVSFAHTDADIEKTIEAYREAARMFHKFLG